jgi:hypothetical protein
MVVWRYSSTHSQHQHRMEMRGVVSFTPRKLYPQGKSPQYPLDRRLGGAQSRSWRGGEERDPCTCQESSPQCSHYTDWATRTKSVNSRSSHLHDNLSDWCSSWFLNSKITEGLIRSWYENCCQTPFQRVDRKLPCTLCPFVCETSFLVWDFASAFRRELGEQQI